MWSFILGIIGNLIASAIEWGLQWLWKHRLVRQLSFSPKLNFGQRSAEPLLQRAKLLIASKAKACSG
jgi:hypothetical protein